MILHNRPVVLHKKHMKLHRNVMPFLKEALYLASLQEVIVDDQGFAVITVRFDRVIGQCDCVETTDEDMIVYAVRQGRDRHMRFVMDRDGMHTSKLTMIVVSQRDQWKLISAWFGGAAAKEPQDPNQTPEERLKSIEFWSWHALLWGSQPIYKHTIMTVCPW